jgi:predicted PurR-regulated permease PerM
MELILPRVKRRSLAVSIAFFFILVPFFLFSIVLISALVDQLVDLRDVPQIQRLIDLTGGTLMEYLVAPPKELITFPTITQGLDAVIKFLSTVGGLFLQVFLAIFFTAYVLYKEDRIMVFAHRTKNHKLWDFVFFVDEGLKQVVFSMFITAFVTGGVATLIYVIFRVPFSILLGALTGFVALMPLLGVWLVYVPITIYFLMAGNITLGLVFLAVCIIFMSIVPDIIVRPIIAGRKEHVDIGLLILGFVTGTLAFGAVGIILGPLIIISLVGFIRILIFEEEILDHHDPKK